MEIVALQNKESITISCTLDQVWLCCYPCLVDCLHDNGTEIASAEFQELLQSYGIQSKLTTVKNPQANGILKCIPRVIWNLLHSSHLITQDLLTATTQQELLMPVMWAINTTFHTTLKASPAQLTFNHDMILPTFCCQLVCYQQSQTNSIAICPYEIINVQQLQINGTILI